jgi:hypothetical protein
MSDKDSIDVKVDLSSISEALKVNEEAYNSFQSLLKTQSEELALLKAQIAQRDAEASFRAELDSLEPYIESGAIARGAIGTIIGDYKSFQAKSGLEIIKAVLDAVQQSSKDTRTVAEQKFTTSVPPQPQDDSQSPVERECNAYLTSRYGKESN